MTSIVSGAAGGALIAALILAAGLTAAAWIALTLASLVIVVGAIDYVRTHG